MRQVRDVSMGLGHLGRRMMLVRDVSAGLGAFETESATGP